MQLNGYKNYVNHLQHRVLGHFVYHLSGEGDRGQHSCPCVLFLIVTKEETIQEMHLGHPENANFT